MTMTDSEWDKLLQIKTTGRDDTHADVYRYPYEPTPYSVLGGWLMPVIFARAIPS